ncbi:MAG: tRNA lysidine(34) synthetase TilS [Cellulosilyticaceae bacterium]
MLKEIEEKVKKNITKYNLIEKGNHIIVGVSGGADSMMLLHFLNKYKAFYQITLEVAHVHHGIREEADEDANYVEMISKEWDIPFNIHYCKVKEIAKEKGITEEEAGRQERYNFFISLTNENDKIATAHNRNDQAETMIMRFLRGSDVRGLGGIRHIRANIIRPILDLERKEIEQYCEFYGILYKEDMTNFKPIYTRNKIRLELIPYIQQNFNPSITNTLADISELYREEDEFLNTYVKERFLEIVCIESDRASININKLNEVKAYIQKRIILKCIYEIIGHTKDITLVHVNKVLQLIKLQTGKKISLPYSLTAIRQYDNIIISSHYKDIITNYDYTLQVGMNNIENEHMQVYLSLQQELPKTVEQTSENMYTKYIDYDKIKDSLHLRTRREKDTITLQAGSKKLKRFFIDQKIPAEIRGQIPLITDGNEVVWIIGNRLNTEYYVTDQTTRVLEIKVMKRQKLQEGLC